MCLPRASQDTGLHPMDIDNWAAWDLGVVDYNPHFCLFLSHFGHEDFLVPTFLGVHRCLKKPSGALELTSLRTFAFSHGSLGTTLLDSEWTPDGIAFPFQGTMCLQRACPRPQSAPTDIDAWANGLHGHGELWTIYSIILFFRFWIIFRLLRIQLLFLLVPS